MEEEEPKKIDLQRHMLSPVSNKYLFRIILYVVLLVGLCYVVFYLYNREAASKKVQDTETIDEIRGITISD